MFLNVWSPSFDLNLGIFQRGWNQQSIKGRNANQSTVTIKVLVTVFTSMVYISVNWIIVTRISLFHPGLCYLVLSPVSSPLPTQHTWTQEISSIYSRKQKMLAIFFFLFSPWSSQMSTHPLCLVYCKLGPCPSCFIPPKPLLPLKPLIVQLQTCHSQHWSYLIFPDYNLVLTLAFKGSVIWLNPRPPYISL